MKTFIKISLIFFVIISIVYIMKPYLFINNSLYKLSTINPQEYTLTPNPVKLFLLNLKVSSSHQYDFK